MEKSSRVLNMAEWAKEKKMTQKDMILNWLKNGKTITPMEALERFGCFRLAARIHNLRESGHNIVATEYETPSGKRVARYSLKATA